MLYYSVVPHLEENTCDSVLMAEIGCAHTSDFFLLLPLLLKQQLLIIIFC